MHSLKNKLFIVFCSIAVTVSIFLSVFSAMGLTPYISGMMDAVCTPFQWCLQKITDGISGFGLYFSSVDALQKENQELKEEINSLRADLERQKYATEENAALRRYMNIASDYSSFVFIDAKVIAKESVSYMTVFKVDKGEKDGVRKNMPVITTDGVVGYVSSVSAFTCKITAIIEAGTSVGAYIPQRNVYGILKGSYNLKADGNVQLSYIDEKAVFYVGDSVYTNGDGSIYPRGLLIGTVSEVAYDAYSRTLSATVSPAVDFEKIEQVLIITDFSNQQEATEETENTENTNAEGTVP